MSKAPVNPDVKTAAAAIGQTLDQAKIPHLLFGWTALAPVIVDLGLPVIDFLVPDKRVAAAVNALEKVGHKACTDPKCPDLSEDRGPASGDALSRYHPVPDAHFHLAGASGTLILLSLFKKDDLLPHLPDLKLGLPSKKEYEYLTLSMDPRLPAPRADGTLGPGPGPSGPWYDLHPVRILNLPVTAESLMLLRCRHYQRKPEIDNLWRDMIWEIRRAKLPEVSKFDRELKGCLQVFWECLVMVSPNVGPEAKLKFSKDDSILSFRETLKEGGRDPDVKPSWLRKKQLDYSCKWECRIWAG